MWRVVVLFCCRQYRLWDWFRFVEVFGKGLALGNKARHAWGRLGKVQAALIMMTTLVITSCIGVFLGGWLSEWAERGRKVLCVGYLGAIFCFGRCCTGRKTDLIIRKNRSSWRTPCTKTSAEYLCSFSTAFDLVLLRPDEVTRMVRGVQMYKPGVVLIDCQIDYDVMRSWLARAWVDS